MFVIATTVSRGVSASRDGAPTCAWAWAPCQVPRGAHDATHLVPGTSRAMKVRRCACHLWFRLMAVPATPSLWTPPGVPVCAVPFGRDQLEVARRVEVAGAGVQLSGHRAERWPTPRRRGTDHHQPPRGRAYRRSIHRRQRAPPPRPRSNNLRTRSAHGLQISRWRALTAPRPDRQDPREK